jgi:H+-translocating NAD(P) transhydrogenase subunit alpha
VVITTALIPGRPAPRLVSDAMLASMRPGSVVVDLAVEQGGNVEGAELGRVVEKHGVKIVGHANVPSRLAVDASQLYARNLFSFLALLVEKGAGAVKIDLEDEIVKGTLLTKDGQIVNPALAKAAE